MKERVRHPQQLRHPTDVYRFKQVLPHFFIVAAHNHQHLDFAGMKLPAVPPSIAPIVTIAGDIRA
jgi:hypothetical protein